MRGTIPAPDLFTAGLVDGLATGAADADRDGLVSVEDAFVYAARHVLEHGGVQTPQRWLYAAEGSIVLARSPADQVITPASLPEHIITSLDSPSPHVRIGAANELGELLSGSNPALALAARDALEQVAEHDSRESPPPAGRSSRPPKMTTPDRASLRRPQPCSTPCQLLAPYIATPRQVLAPRSSSQRQCLQAAGPGDSYGCKAGRFNPETHSPRRGAAR